LFLKRKPVGEYIRSVLGQTGLNLAIPLFDGTTITVKAWKAQYGQASVYFLDLPSVADVVYPCGEDAPPMTPNPNEWADVQRLKQSWMVGRGALALAKALNFQPDIIVQSETPTIFGAPTLVMDAFQKDPFFAQSRTVFNDHTPLEYAHPIWPARVLKQVQMDPAVYQPFLTGHGEAATVDITRLLVGTSAGVFGVAKKHGDVMRAMPSLRDYAAKIKSITNGVSQDMWQDKSIAQAAQGSDEQLIAAKDALKETLIQWMWRRASLWPTWIKATRGKPLLLWTRRVTSYKRLDILYRVLCDEKLRKRFMDTQVVLVVGGRIYQRDNVSEKMVYELVELLNKNADVGDRVIFLDNFNVWEAPLLYQAADGSIMLSDDGREASATGFMKALMNAGMILANSDGAVPEFVNFKGQEKAGRGPNGFGVSYSHGQPDAESFVRGLEDFSAVYKNPAQRAGMMRAALAVTPEVSVRRTAEETVTFYKGVLGQ
jgi:glucan phosphorylase